MKNRRFAISSLVPLSLTIAFMFMVCTLHATAQENPIKIRHDKLLPPVEEQFQAADGLAAPWRKSGCYVSNLIYKVPNCYDVGSADWDRADVLSIYNADGSLWYRFSLTDANPDYFLKNKKEGFLPFAVFPPGGENRLNPDKVILRIIRESPHWWEVEVNEETRATKYIIKNDSKWAQTEWIRWLHESIYLNLQKGSQIYEQPDGKIIEEAWWDLDVQRAEVLKAKGDWVYVERVSQQKVIQGWVRWRNGRNILVGWIFNDWEVPERLL